MGVNTSRFLLLSLGGVLRDANAQLVKRPRSTAWFNAWCVVFSPPIAMAMAQETLNELAGHREQ
ncbi:hypothetical protein DIE07_29145 [Burkholderia sp. Bp9002]|nr:hypothetical protein DIE18_37465 [Burkholderia sp. Bp9125]RQS04369.1 hypothetical protein DIE07_29145 [Burkholderia sp. Bp9002]